MILSNKWSKEFNRMNFDIDGRIESVSLPKFNAKRKIFIINVKVNGKWKHIWRRNESECNDVYQRILEIKAERDIGIDRKTTYLSENQIKDSEIAFDKLTSYYGADEVIDRRLLTKAVDFFIDKTPTLKAPIISECIDFFFQQRKDRISSVTLRDYKYILRRFNAIFGDRRINSISSEDIKEYFDRFDNYKRTAVHIYLKSFFEFCCGKANPYAINGKGWINYNPINYKVPQYIPNEVEVLPYDAVIQMLLEIEDRNYKSQKGEQRGQRSKNEVLCYYLFRLFSCVRREEFVRLIEIGGKDILTNKFIDLERRRIILTTEIYRKKGSVNNNGSGRIFSPICDTFFSWIEWMVKNKIELKYPMGRLEEYELKKVCEKYKLKKRNILRHTAITYHILNFKDTMLSCKNAGTSLRIIESHYLCKNIPTAEGESFYELNVEKAIELNIIN